MNKTASSEPGPGTYILDGHFLSGKNPRDIVFPKGSDPTDKGSMGPGPGSYRTGESMGHQPLSTKKNGNTCRICICAVSHVTCGMWSSLTRSSDPHLPLPLYRQSGAIQHSRAPVHGGARRVRRGPR